MAVDSSPEASRQENLQPDPGRREFVKSSGRALYLAPTLTLLGSVRATAAIPSSPPPPPGGAAPAAPAAPGPNQ
ncbi:MAG: hypothetical protein R3E50_11125 [Halioglobus sp.]